MTHQEIVRGFTMQLDKVNSGSLPELTSNQKLFYINKHLIQTVSNKYSGYNPIQKGFEEIELRTSELRNLVKEDNSLTLTSSTSYNTDVSSSEVTLQSYHLYLLRHTIQYRFKKKGCNDYSNWLKGTIYKSSLDNVEKLLNDPFNTPEYGNILIETIDNKVRFYYNSSTQIQSYVLTYLRLPTLLTSITSTTNYTDLPDKVLYEVINNAIAEVLENIESERLQTIQNELSKET